MILKISTFIFFSLVFIAPQSFVLVKLPFLLICMLGIAIRVCTGASRAVSRTVLLYYVGLSLLVLPWALIGAIRGNPEQAVVEAIKMYILYIWIYAAFILYFSEKRYQEVLYPFFCFVALGISAVCFYVLADFFLDLGFLSEAVKKEMYLEIGVHHGYVQMNNVNIGMLCFLLPFILSWILLKAKPVGKLSYLVLVIVLASAILASRRIVLVLFILTPFLTLLIHWLSRGVSTSVGTRVFRFYFASAVMACVILGGIYTYDDTIFEGFSSRFVDILVVDKGSERQVQNVALLEGFLKYPIVGSGFGGLTDVIRSEERPWNYELTYSKLLFNSGFVGVFAVLSFFLLYLVLAIIKVRHASRDKAIYISMLVGYCAVMIASASNPYLSSFDFIFVFSLIPLILSSGQDRRACVSDASNKDSKTVVA